jgi:hypothetical protein
MIYPTKKDLWITLIVLLGGLAILIQAGSLIVVKGFNHPETWIICGAAIFYFGILWLLAYPINYEITLSTLEICSGILLHYKIPLSSIVRVSSTRNPLSSPAWSLDRLRIDYIKNGKKRVILISPKDKEDFLRQLVKMAPALESKGNETMTK